MKFRLRMGQIPEKRCSGRVLVYSRILQVLPATIEITADFVAHLGRRNRD